MNQEFQVNIKNISKEEKKLREESLKLFTKEGFPSKRLEEWKFTDLNKIIGDNFKELNSSKDLKENLLAANHSLNEIKDFLDVDSIAYLSIDGLYRAMGHKEGRDPKNTVYTDHCFTGEYPTQLRDQKNDGHLRQLSLLSEPG